MSAEISKEQEAFVKKMPKRRGNRYSISVSGQTHDRLRNAVPRGGVASFVEGLLTTALGDPAILARLVDKCRYEEQTP